MFERPSEALIRLHFFALELMAFVEPLLPSELRELGWAALRPKQSLPYDAKTSAELLCALAVSVLCGQAAYRSLKLTLAPSCERPEKQPTDS